MFQCFNCQSHINGHFLDFNGEPCCSACHNKIKSARPTAVSSTSAPIFSAATVTTASSAALKEFVSRKEVSDLERRCDECTEIVHDTGIQLPNGALYHQRCFWCAECGKELTGKYVLEHGKTYHPAVYIYRTNEPCGLSFCLIFNAQPLVSGNNSWTDSTMSKMPESNCQPFHQIGGGRLSQRSEWFPSLIPHDASPMDFHSALHAHPAVKHWQTNHLATLLRAQHARPVLQKLLYRHARRDLQSLSRDRKNFGVQAV